MKWNGKEGGMMSGKEWSGSGRKRKKEREWEWERVGIGVERSKVG